MFLQYKIAIFGPLWFSKNFYNKHMVTIFVVTIT